MLNNVGAVILAAGLGKRMQSQKLKVMHELNGRPLIDYVVAAVENSLLAVKPVVVVASDDNSVQKYLGERAEYVVQAERLGTGHAVARAESLLKEKLPRVVVLYGDMPFINPGSIDRLIKEHERKDSEITLMTAVVEDFQGWRENFMDYGRIARDKNGHIIRSVEKKDATPAELLIKELNVSLYCFDSKWLWSHLGQLKNNNAQGEYYLTDLVGLAVSEGTKISSILIDPREAVGINTVENLAMAEKLFLL